MKNIYIFIAAALIFFMLLLPLLSLKEPEKPQQSIQKNEQLAEPSFAVLNTKTGEINEVSAEEYIFGVVAAEMPAIYEKEALKAQAVAAHTYALYKKEKNAAEPYDITNDFSIDQAFITRTEAIEKWGSNAAEYENKINNAVREVAGQYLTYGGKPILALYHAISGGKTESCANVFGNELPYLCVIDSAGDLLNPEYCTVQAISPQDFKSILEGRVAFLGEPREWITNVQYRENGYVESITVCGTEISGREIRSLFSLRSANFDVAFGENFDFTVRGYGHGVGLSQSGANYMAQQSMSYIEILNWYYPGCTLK